MTSDSDFNLPNTLPLIQEKLTKTSTSNARARCAQCGKSMRDMPMFLQNITCRDCYGMERYRRGEANTIAIPQTQFSVVPEEKAS